MGTPKTLMQAIQNGIDDVDRTGRSVEQSIQLHVSDFIRNRLSPAMLSDDKNEVKIVQQIKAALLGRKAA